MTQRDWQKDNDLLQKKPQFTLDEVNYIIYTISPYWLQEAKERGEREQRLKGLLLDAIGCLMIHTSDYNSDVKRISQGLRTLYPDTPAPKEGE